MSNNKKNLKRTVASFLAAVNVLNFFGGSGKAADPWSMFNGSIEQANENQVKNVDYLKNFLDLLTDIDFEEVSALLSVEKLELLKEIESLARFYKLKEQDVLFIDFVGNKFSNINSDIKNIMENAKIKNQKFVIYKVERGAYTQQDVIAQALNSNSEINFINVNGIENLKAFCENFKEKQKLAQDLKEEREKVEKLGQEKQNAEKEKEKEKEELNKKINEAKEENDKLKEENDKLKEENEAIKIYVCKNNALKKLVKSLQEKLDNSSLKGTAKELGKVKEDIEFGDVKFKLVGENDNSFLGNCEFKYGDEEKTFSINELIEELVEYNLIKRDKFEKLEPIKLEEITKKVKKQLLENNEQKEEDVLNVEEYNGKLQGYIEALQQIIKAIDSMPGSYRENEELNNQIKEFKQNNINCKNKAEEILQQLGESSEASGDLEKQLEMIEQKFNVLNNEKTEVVNQNNTAKAKLKTANRKANIFKIVAGLGWIGAFATLGYAFQNELKNACGIAYNKVLELKNKMLNK